MKQRSIRILLIASGVVVVLALCGGAVFVQAQAEKSQAARFKADAQHLGFDVIGDPEWETETSKGKSESVMEMIVNVGGCPVELERRPTGWLALTSSGGAANGSTVVNNKKIVHFEVDEVTHNGREYELSSPEKALRPSDVLDILKGTHGTKRPGCFTG